MKLKKILSAGVLLLIGFVSAPSFAQIPNSTPAWFFNDLQRNARWLPAEIRQLGLNAALQQRWASLSPAVQNILIQQRIPAWMIALIPTDPSKQDEIMNQILSMGSLTGAPSMSAIGARAEQLLFFGGAAQLPTPGDAKTGASLGAEGCSAAMSKYILAELKIEFPEQLASLPDQLANLQSSAQMKALFIQIYNAGATWLVVRDVSFANLQNQDVEPGSMMIAQKPGGTHVFGWTRVPSFWGWAPSDHMAIGNTGLPQFGDRMILAQEFLTDDPSNPNEFAHNLHGPINSRQVIYSAGRPNLSDSRTNVYASRGSDFIIVSFR